MTNNKLIGSVKYLPTQDQSGLYNMPQSLFYSQVVKIFFLFLNQNICCGYSKEPSRWDGSFEHPKHMLKVMGKKIFTILRWSFLLI